MISAIRSSAFPKKVKKMSLLYFSTRWVILIELPNIEVWGVMAIISERLKTKLPLMDALSSSLNSLNLKWQKARLP